MINRPKSIGEAWRIMQQMEARIKELELMLEAVGQTVSRLQARNRDLMRRGK